MDGENTLTVADCISLIRRRFGIIVLAGLLGALVGAAYLARSQPDYESTARLVLNPVVDNPGSTGAGGGANAAATLTATQKSILRSDEVTQRAADRLDDGTSADRLRDSSSVEVLPDSLALDVTYEASNPAAAQAGAQALVESYLDVRAGQEMVRKTAMVDALTKRFAGLEKTINATATELKQVDPQANPTTVTVLNIRLTAQLAQQGKVDTELSAWQSLDTTPGYVVTPAGRPASKSGLGGAVVLIGAIAAALIAGFVVAMIYDRNDPKVRRAADLQDLVGAPPVDVIAGAGVDGGYRKWFGRSAGEVPDEPGRLADGPAGESYRRLALRLGGWPGPWPRFVLVTSAGPALAEEVAANLAVTLGREGSRVLLIWSNLRQDTLDAYFSVPAGPGLGEVLADLVKVEEAVLEIPGCQGLSLLPVGSRSEARGELFRFPALKETLADVDRIRFDQVILIAPSSEDYADALALATQVDDVLVTVELGSTDRHALETTLDDLRSINAHLAGVVAL